MATDLERLVVQLSADVRGYENAMRRAQGITTRQTRAIESQWSRANKNVAAGFAGLGKQLAAVFAVGASLRGAQQLVDTATRIENALKVAGLAGQELDTVYRKLFESAQRNSVPLEAMATLFGRVAQAQDALKVSQEEVVNFSDKIGVALRVSGASAEQASGALLQLSQALGAGVVRAEEFNSINEGARPILQAVAAGLKEAGGSVAKLRSLVLDGAISSEVFFRAFEAGAPMLEEKLAGAELTVSQSFVRLQNVLIDTAGELNESSGATARMAEALENLGDWIRDTDFSPLINGVMDFGSAVVATIGQIEDLARAAGKAVGADAVGRYLKGSRAEMIGQDAIQARFDGAFSRPTEITATKPNSVVKPISKADYAPPESKDKKAKKQRLDDYARETKQIIDRTAALVAETEAQRQINPLIDDYGYAIEKARVTRELLTAAEDAGKKITPQLREEIAALAEQYAIATVEAGKLAESQDKVRDRAEEMRDLGKDIVGGFTQDLINGTSAADAFANALGKIAEKLLDIGLNNLFGESGSGGLGILGSILGGQTRFAGGIMSGARVGLFHNGGLVGAPGGMSRTVHPGVFAGAKRMHSGGMAGGLRPDEVPAILQRGEIVLPKGARSGGGNPLTVDARTTIDARGADQAAIARLQVAMAQRDAELPARVVAAVRQAQRSNVKLR